MIEISKYVSGYNYIPIICGPTASGKSSLALSLCEEIGAELVSADSMQIYKYMNIGTAKATSDEQARVKHHLIDIVEPGEYFSVSDYISLCEKEIITILEKGKLPVICGGTGQYISALLYGLDYEIDLDTAKIDQYVDRISSEYEANGIEGIFHRLEIADPEAASKIHPNNTRRVIRALSVYEATGTTFSEKNRKSRTSGAKFPFKLFQIDLDRDQLYNRINKRVDIMVEEGLIDEVKDLYARKIDPKSTCMQAIGYKELIKYVAGESILEEAINEIKLNTRHYAKRQLTWFRYINGIVSLCQEDMTLQVKSILTEIK